HRADARCGVVRPCLAHDVDRHGKTLALGPAFRQFDVAVHPSRIPSALVLRPARHRAMMRRTAAQVGGSRNNDRPGGFSMLKTTITGSLPKPSWLAQPEKLWAPWSTEDPARLEEAKRDAVRLALLDQAEAGIDI